MLLPENVRKPVMSGPLSVLRRRRRRDLGECRQAEDEHAEQGTGAHDLLFLSGAGDLAGCPIHARFRVLSRGLVEPYARGRVRATVSHSYWTAQSPPPHKRQPMGSA